MNLPTVIHTVLSLAGGLTVVGAVVLAGLLLNLAILAARRGAPDGDSAALVVVPIGVLTAAGSILAFMWVSNNMDRLALPEFMVTERIAVDDNAAVNTVEDYYRVTVMDSLGQNEYLVRFGDGAATECELRKVGEATVDGQEAVLLCNGAEPNQGSAG